jgi:hypothetical protein
MSEREELTGSGPGGDELAWIEKEYQALIPKLEAEMDLERWEERRRELLKALRERRRLERDFARRASQLNALMLARGAAMGDVSWEESIGRVAFNSIFIRLELYRADVHIAHLKTPGSRLRLRRWEMMEGSAFAAFMEARAARLKRVREAEVDGSLLDHLASGGTPRIVDAAMI